MENQSHWRTVFLESEICCLDSLATFLCFLSSHLQSTTTTERSKQAEIEVQIISSLSLIEKMHMYLVHRKTLLSGKDSSQIEDTILFRHERMEQSIQNFEQILESCHFIRKKYKQQGKRILGQLTGYYCVHFVKVVITQDTLPSTPWISK